MGKPVAGDVVVLPFPQADLYQITSQIRSDGFSISLTQADFQSG